MIKKTITIFLLIALSACKKSITPPSTLENIKTSITGIWGLTNCTQISTYSRYCNGNLSVETTSHSENPYEDSALFVLALTADGNVYSNISALSSNAGKGWQLIDAKRLGLNGKIATIDTVNRNIFRFTTIDSASVSPVVAGCYDETRYLSQYHLIRLNK